MTPTRYQLRRELHIPLPRDEVFAFFSDAANLERITPNFLRFKILTPLPLEMKPGAIIDYELRLFMIPFRWRTEITEYVPNEHFADVQVKGPYKVWDHRHEFRDAPDGGTIMTDTVNYDLLFGPLGRLAHALMVKRSVRKIFDHRNATILDILLHKGETVG
ncbi:MAG: CDP-paratose 2-epimerase [candidate division Zixibacteria bacterium]|nr:CDP-paratose 2-epimerase [candidate division Zixibacteria bacterium]